jgi:hypothetical protein
MAFSEYQRQAWATNPTLSLTISHVCLVRCMLLRRQSAAVRSWRNRMHGFESAGRGGYTASMSYSDGDASEVKCTHILSTSLPDLGYSSNTLL